MFTITDENTTNVKIKLKKKKEKKTPESYACTISLQSEKYDILQENFENLAQECTITTIMSAWT